jgi:sec-independent protein translocase protein TatA
MFGSLGAPELIIIAVVIILIFGVGKLSGLGKDLGSSIKEFRRAVKDEDEEKPPVAASAPAQQTITAPPQQPQQPPANFQQPSQPPVQPNDAQKPNIF